MQPLLIQLAVGKPDCETPTAYRTVERDFIGAVAGEGSGSLQVSECSAVVETVAQMLFELFDGANAKQVEAAIRFAVYRYTLEAAPAHG